MREPDGFAAFVAARSPALVRTARLLTGDHAAAEDLVQHALARTWPRWSRLRDPAAGEAYVRKVLVTSYATSRRRRWHGELPSEQLPDHAATGDAYARSDERAAMTGALATLTARQRAVVVLRYYDDLTEAQAADVLGVSVGTVKSQSHKALARLREHLGSDAVAHDPGGHLLRIQPSPAQPTPEVPS